MDALHVFVDRFLNCGVGPRQRQSHDARGHLDVGQIAEFVFDRLQHLEKIFERENAAIVMDLQRADAGCLIEDALEVLEADGSSHGA